MAKLIRCGCLARFWAAAVAVLLVPLAAPATEFEYGEIEGRLDTTLSFGMAVRTQSPDKSNYCTALGGSNGDCGKSDGNLNYKRGHLTSAAIKGQNELDIRWRNFGAFVRGSYFLDFENQFGHREHVRLRKSAKDVVGFDAKLLDAFVTADFVPHDEFPLSFRVGNQVISWGESTFIQNGINVINPVDVGKLRVPGSELKEALLPVWAGWASLGLGEFFELEGFYQFDSRRTKIDPSGSFFSVSDGLGKGGRWFDVSQGHNDCATNPAVFGFPSDGTAPRPLCIRRGSNMNPSDQGQWGLALRTFVPFLNGAEFGLYFINFHSRLPYISGQFDETLIQAAIRLLGRPPANDLEVAFLANTILEQTTARAEYPEDIQKIGVSASTTSETLGIALQGELAYTIDQPIQLAEDQLLLGLFEGLGLPVSEPTQPGVTPPGPGEFFSGAIRKDMLTTQWTITKIFEPGRVVGGWLHADQAALVGEWGMVYFIDMEKKRNRSYQGAVTPSAVSNGASARQNTSHATPFSTGMVVRGALTYNDAIFGVNLQPVLGFQWDISGNTPIPLGMYVANRMAVNIGLRADYLNRYSGEVSYTNFFGGGKDNSRRDRDFFAFNLKYSF